MFFADLTARSLDFTYKVDHWPAAISGLARQTAMTSGQRASSPDDQLAVASCARLRARGLRGLANGLELCMRRYINKCF